jgi:serpin B
MKALKHILLAGLVILCAATPATSPQKIAQNNNAFAFDLYREIIKSERGNVFFSPFSISTALAMTYAGANATTADEMQKAMHFSANDEEFHVSNGTYVEQLHRNAKGNIQLKIANRLWGEETYTLKQSFIDLNAKAYRAPLQMMDFQGNSEGSRLTINEWVAEKTEQRILNLIPSGAITNLTRLVLTNAIYFKGDWQNTFDKTQTRDQTFTMADGKTLTTPFMNSFGSLEYVELKNARMVRLPYKGNKQSMIIILPYKTENLEELEAEIDATFFAKVFNAFEPEVILSLPKFKMTLPLSLNGNLQGLGMETAFTPFADFSKMTASNDLYISAVLHKAFIEIDEEGTEAAAATAVIMNETEDAHDRALPKQFIADHPFLFYIIDDETKAILFMGRLMVPEL